MMSRMLNKSERVLPDKDMDLMFHALGRPVDIRRECYRNNFCCSTRSAQSIKFQASKNWLLVRTNNAGKNLVFEVSKIGIQVLDDYLDELAYVNDDPEEAPHDY